MSTSLLTPIQARIRERRNRNRVKCDRKVDVNGFRSKYRQSVNSVDSSQSSVCSSSVQSSTGSTPTSTSSTNISGERCEKSYGTNWISTTKYTLVTFIPKNLFEQFCRVANLYFLFILILSYTPVSPVAPGPSSINLGIVLLINAVKEGYEDFKRYKSDKRINHQIAQVIKNGEIVNKFWKELEVGDVVKVNNEEQFPADMVLLSTTNDSPGLCYIETSNLDGETNLKTKQALMETNQMMQKSEDVSQFCACVEYEPPSQNLIKFDGRITLPNGETLPLTSEQLLIRGTQLMNTKSVYGVVAYTGHETKYMLNTMATPSKRSKLELTMNRILIWVLIAEALLCLCSAILGMVYEIKTGRHSFYLQFPKHKVGLRTLERFFTFVVLYSTIVPISLYVTMEIVRVLQIIFINRDKKMLYRPTMTYAKARTSNLNEELGQVEHIFSDKTGTLTRNEMVFRICSINGICYGQLSSDYLPVTESILNVSQDASQHKSPSISTIDLKSLDASFNSQYNKSNNNLADMDRPLQVDFSLEENLEFFIALSLCHTVIPDKIDDNENDISSIKYSSSSPDEIALVTATSNLGIKFISRTPQSMSINVNGTDKTYQLLNVIDFTSDRKRMSVIVRENNSQQVILYCKGADSAILPFVKFQNESSDKEKEAFRINQENLNKFSCNGLRTLCIARKVLDFEEYEKWSQLYKKACISIDERNEKIAEVSTLIEKDWQLIGVTGIEDKLQESVPSTIATLSRANIKIWMLTGDKQETAINIGISCKLLEGAEILILNEPNNEKLLVDAIDNCIQQIETERGVLPCGASTGQSLNNSPASVIELESIGNHQEKTNTTLDSGKPVKDYALVIDGATLSLTLTKEIEDKFYKLTCLCKSVVCCRVTPFQKSEVVRMVKDRTDSILLAIGDGANDVSMIQKAHIGIGIGGKEGRQAVLASDFAIAQFKYLERLILVHGRRNYKRLCLLICYFFFKNLMASLLQLWFSSNTQFSGQTFYDAVNILGYNLVFTSLPIIVIAVFEKDIGSYYLKKFPQLYRECQMGRCFNHKVFWSWIVMGIYSSAVVYFFTSHIFIEGPTDKDGRIAGMWQSSAAGFTSLVVVVNLRLTLCVNTWTPLHHITIWGTLIVYAIIESSYSLIYITFTGYFHGIFNEMVTQPIFSFSLIITVLVALMPAYTVSYVYRNYFTKPIHVAQEIQRQEKEILRKKIKTLNII